MVNELLWSVQAGLPLPPHCPRARARARRVSATRGSAGTVPTPSAAHVDAPGAAGRLVEAEDARQGAADADLAGPVQREEAGARSLGGEELVDARRAGLAEGERDRVRDVDAGHVAVPLVKVLGAKLPRAAVSDGLTPRADRARARTLQIDTGVMIWFVAVFVGTEKLVVSSCGVREPLR